MTIRSVARIGGELALIWLLAATASAAFLPRGFGPNTLDQLALVNPSVLSGVAVAAVGLAGCAGLWWLLSHEMLTQLALAALAVLALALVLPGGLTPYFLPPPLALLLSAFLLNRFPDAAGPPGEDGGAGPAARRAPRR